MVDLPTFDRKNDFHCRQRYHTWILWVCHGCNTFEFFHRKTLGKINTLHFDKDIFQTGGDYPPASSCKSPTRGFFCEWLTLPETNIAPENRPSQKENSIPTIHVQGLC